MDKNNRDMKKFKLTAWVDGDQKMTLETWAVNTAMAIETLTVLLDDRVSDIHVTKAERIYT